MTTDNISIATLTTNNEAKLAYGQNNKNESKNLDSLEEKINRSAVSVSISMNAQIVLMGLESSDISKGNTSAQHNLSNIFGNKEIFNFLSGQENEGFLSLKDLGYEGKAITELNSVEAEALISDEGFFGVEQTSKRVADFAINISGNNLEALQASREGIVQGFKDAEKMWNGELPEISYRTQESTLALIDARIQKMENNS
jgi:hypothetical protein